MPLAPWLSQAEPFPGQPRSLRLRVDITGWSEVAAAAAAARARLLALWASPARSGAAPARVYATVAHAGDLLTLELALAEGATTYPGLASLFPAAARLERAAFDLCGIAATDVDHRPWLRHAAWPGDFHPLVHAQPVADGQPTIDDYAFLRVDGDGVHEIPVGPVHAGIIEPGHFRFSVVGEKVLKLEARLGYVHKGIERRFTELGVLEAHRLAARVSGDSAVAYALAYCQAAEALCGIEVPARGRWLRALCLEIERLQNHLGDLGALGNDAGFAFGLAQFSRLKESLLRALEACIGQRYLLDAVVPGGVGFDLDTGAKQTLAANLASIARGAGELEGIYADHGGLRDRFAETGRVTPELAAILGLVGLGGRASGQTLDLRIDHPVSPYDVLAPRRRMRIDGDVAARVGLRFDELQESCRFGAAILNALPEGETCAATRLPAADGTALGLVEGWRGPTLIALEVAAGGAIRRCHPHDPSWQNWPALEHAVMGNIVPDFPLINKSFNLSYSGHDL